VLTDDGFLVVGEAATVSDLARVLHDAEPDVIVLDDSIGVAAVQLAAELSPRAKLVVIWPAAVMPIAGAARVDPGEVGMALSATVGLVAGVSGLGSIERPEWIEKVRKDPAALRAKLATSGAAPVRPSVTELQRRGQRLHPSPGAGRRRSTRSARAAAVAGGLSLASAETTAGEGAAAAHTASETDALVSRRIGMIALGGAAVAGALMIALSFGPNRSPAVITAARFIPPLTAPTAGPPTTTDPTPGGDGQNPGPTTPPPTGGGTTPTSPPTSSPATSSPPTSPPPAGGAGGPGGSGGTGGGGSGGSGSRNVLAAVAGSSIVHNPHGGAPGLKDSGSAAQNPHGGPPGLTDGAGGHGPNGSHAGGHTPHGDHPVHPLHSHKL
jgi:hypothetical protein